MNVGQNIAKYRKEQNLTQQQLGDIVGVNSKTISKWELDQNEPDIVTMKSLANLFNISLDKLLDNPLENLEKEKQMEIAMKSRMEEMETKLNSLEDNVQKMDEIQKSFTNLIDKQKKDNKKSHYITFFTIALAIGCIVLAITVIYLIKITLK